MKAIHPTIVITGGHVTPALAVVDVLRKKYPAEKIVCIGRAHAFEGTYSPSNEKRLMEERHVAFVPIEAGRIRRFLDWGNVIALIKIPVGFFQAFVYLLFHRPKVILSFGGYIAVPVALAGKILGISLVTHEQTSVIGTGNRLIAAIADTVCVSFPDTRRLFPKGKAVMTGLPIRSSMDAVSEKHSVRVPDNSPIIYITGGSTGAQTLNDLCFPLISVLVKNYSVVHQTGIVSLPKAKEVRAKIPEKIRERYIIRDFFDETDVSYFLYHARLVIGRAGANSTAEILRSDVPTILIPLPWSGEQEQWHNARVAASIGPVSVIDQEKTTPDELLHHIVEILSKREKRKSNISVFFAPSDAAEKIVAELSPFIRGNV